MDYEDVKINAIFRKDFTSICRICIKKEETLKPFKQVSLQGIFKNITDIEIDSEENLPKNICDRCIRKLENINSFINLCKSNDAYLKQINQKEITESHLEDTGSEFDVVHNSIEYSNDTKTEDMKIKEHHLTSHLRDLTAKVLSVPECPGAKDKVSSTKKEPHSSNSEAWGENVSTKHNSKRQKENASCTTRQYTCTYCEMAFFKKSTLKLHMRSHTKEAPYECEVCSKKFRFSQNLKRHIDIIHKGMKPFKCNICKKEFARHTNLVEHERDHSGEIPFICNYCGLSFKKTGPYHYHLNLHRALNSENNSGDLTCNICGKIFGSKSTLKKHGITHTKENHFLCEICGKDFRSKQILGNHIRVHLGLRPYKCGYCEKSFSRKSTLAVHTLYHTKEKPFKCKTCLKMFAQVAHLKNHERIHNGDRPFKCTYCSRTFSVKCNLVIHTRIHTNDTTYKCTVCGKMCYESRSLKRHMKMHQDSSLIVLTNEDITTLLS